MKIKPGEPAIQPQQKPDWLPIAQFLVVAGSSTAWRSLKNLARRLLGRKPCFDEKDYFSGSLFCT